MQITKEPEKILRKKLKSVEKITPEIKALISDMREKVIEAHGVGLAANQVGQDIRIFVIDKKTADAYKVPEAYFNPEITEYSPEIDEVEEGCLSIPGSYFQIRRSKKIMFKALDENGKKIKFKARGFLARVLQHETDHLSGKVFIDRTKDIHKYVQPKS